MKRFVVDGSVTVAWCLTDETSPYAEVTLQALRNHVARVPSLWAFEVANALLIGERRQRLTRAELQRILDDLDALPIELEWGTPGRAQREILELARQEGLTVYDAAYLELAIREGLPLATLDDALRQAAERRGVPEFLP